LSILILGTKGHKELHKGTLRIIHLSNSLQLLSSMFYKFYFVFYWFFKNNVQFVLAFFLTQRAAKVCTKGH
jgi:hypothetical protein